MQNSEYMSANRIDWLVEKIEAETGLSFPETRLRDLKLAIHRMAESLRLDSDAECIDWLLSGRWEKSKADLCALHLTIGETYFFREPRAFGLVCDYAREKIRDSEGATSRLRIWSAGCSTGEEPYSIAMALKHAVPELGPRQISILGTDINSRHLQFARAGAYRHWSFRNNDPTLQKLNFSEHEGKFRLNDEIKELVKFSELNLAAPAYPSVTTDTHAMDIIFCRNVLMYFSKRQAMKVIERFRQCLVNGGWLIVSPSEASAELFSGFSGVYYPDAIYFRKNDPADCPTPSGRAFTSSGPPGNELERSDKKDDIGHTVLRGAELESKPGNAKDSVRPRPNVSRNAGKTEAESDAARRARILANEGKSAEAMRCLEQAIKDRPASVDLYYAKALVAMESGDTGGAMHSLKRVIYLQPDCIIAHYLMGVIQSRLDRYAEASRRFETVSELLSTLKSDDIVPFSEGLSAAYLLESVQSFLRKEVT
jgi:chemotaxis protein methyltransferase CheR